ncbi:hypothetical protein QZH41_009598, partial [Actinostola sp. cb2023]
MCMRRKGKSRNMAAICQLSPAPGPCRAAMPQWYYNPKRQRCSRFIYGGCGGNDNNFDSKDECKAACMRNKGSKLTHPTEPAARLSSEMIKALAESHLTKVLVVDSPHSCLDPVTGDYYKQSEMWQQDDCTACICGAGRKYQCRKTTCRDLTCAKTIKLKGRCCPACASDTKTGTL